MDAAASNLIGSINLVTVLIFIGAFAAVAAL